jgi:hypothetical protein
MKNIFKISAVLFLVISLVVSSCKKEEVLIDGCTDSSAMNYIPDATSNDGSCIYAYQVAIGIWNIDPDCDDVDILGQTISLNEQMPETIDVQANGDNSLFIDMNGTQVSGDIDNEGNIVVNEQNIQIDPGLGFPIDVVVSGSGKIESENSGYMDLTYEFEIPIVGGTEEVDCQLTLTK